MLEKIIFFPESPENKRPTASVLEQRCFRQSLFPVTSSNTVQWEQMKSETLEHIIEYLNSPELAAHLDWEVNTTKDLRFHANAAWWGRSCIEIKLQSYNNI